jgi:hypothetical protein
LGNTEAKAFRSHRLSGLLRNNLSGSGSGRDKLHAQLGGLAFESLEHLFLVLVLIIVCTMIDILTFIFEHMIDNPGDLARGGDNRFGRAVLGPPAAKEGSQGGLAPADGLGRQAKCACSTVGGLARGASQDLAAGDVIVRCEAQPRREMLVVGPRGPIQANVSEDVLHQATVLFVKARPTRWRLAKVAWYGA